MRSGYLKALREVTNDEDVVRLARDYLAQWSPDELAFIPRDSRPGHIRDAEDIADTAMALTRARISSFEPETALTEMEGFFAQACVRLSQLEAATRRREREADFASQ